MLNNKIMHTGNVLAVGSQASHILGRSMTNKQYRQYFKETIDKNENITLMNDYRVIGVDKSGSKIKKIKLEHAPYDEYGCPPEEGDGKHHAFSAKYFIDASYEGELMAQQGVSYTVGRESADHYGESHAGAEEVLMAYDVDPYNVPGKPSSGLLPGIMDRKAGDKTDGDDLVMGYGFRWKWDFDGGHEITPHNYDPDQFEMFRRGFLAQENGTDVDIAVGHFIRDIKSKEVEEYSTSLDGWVMPENLRRSLLAPQNYGDNKDYPDGDYKTKARIWKAEQSWVRNMVHFFKTDDSVPAPYQQKAKKIKLASGHFDDTHGYPNQLYVREARRMISDYVITQKDMENEKHVEDPIALATYGFDEWPYATIVHKEDGFKTDGIGLVGGYYSCYKLGYPYAIPYSAIVPKKTEASNLLVAVTVSASHVAFSSLRMEPVYLQLGEAAGKAAGIMAMKVDENGKFVDDDIQDIDYKELRAAIEEDGGIVEVTHEMKKDYENLKSGRRHQDINMRLMNLDMQEIKDQNGVAVQGWA